MPKLKKFEEEPYSAINEALMRDAAAVGRDAAAVGRDEEPTKGTPKALKKTKRSAAKRTVTSSAHSNGGRGAAEGVTKRVPVTVDEDMAITALMARLKRANGGRPIPDAVISRALWAMLVLLEDAVVQEVESNPPGKQPSTHEAVARAEYQLRWRDVLMAAMRRARRSS